MDSGKWNDVPCSFLKTFSCKMPASSSPIGTVTTTTPMPDSMCVGLVFISLLFYYYYYYKKSVKATRWKAMVKIAKFKNPNYACSLTYNQLYCYGFHKNNQLLSISIYVQLPINFHGSQEIRNSHLLNIFKYLLTFLKILSFDSISSVIFTFFSKNSYSQFSDLFANVKRKLYLFSLYMCITGNLSCATFFM